MDGVASEHTKKTVESISNQNDNLKRISSEISNKNIKNICIDTNKHLTYRNMYKTHPLHCYSSISKKHFVNGTTLWKI